VAQTLPRDIMLSLDELKTRSETKLRQARLEGERAVLRRQLLQLFGSLSPELAIRLAQGEPADIERWATRILTAPKAEDVLD
ncbi:MAG: hypothetical protein AAGC55_13095, partial [Myxococcota bacterium]